MPETEKMILLAEALEIVERRLVDKTLSNEILPIRQALNQTVVEDQIARLDLPPFNKSAMDGYAIPVGDEREEYRVLETIPAGGIPSKPLVLGKCYFRDTWSGCSLKGVENEKE